jgi:ribosome biogenesis GTPase
MTAGPLWRRSAWAARAQIRASSRGYSRQRRHSSDVSASVRGTVVQPLGTAAIALLHGSARQVRCQMDAAAATAAARQAVAAGAEDSYMIGDRVVLQAPDRTADDSDLVWTVLSRAKRTRTLRRNFSAHRRRGIATGVDTLVVMTAVQPPPNRGLIDRLVLNKVDLGGVALEQARAVMLSYKAAGYPVAEVSVKSGYGLPKLHARLSVAAGQLSVLMGHSGVGKSSLLNWLVPDAYLPTDELSQSRRGFRGRHITTQRTCHLLPLSGQEEPQPTWPECAMVVDTAGVRSFSLTGMSPVIVAHGFREFRALSSQCRCVHPQRPMRCVGAVLRCMAS